MLRNKARCGGLAGTPKTCAACSAGARQGRGRVFLEGRWIEVPDDAIVVAPDKY
jgi:hypothetical protein